MRLKSKNADLSNMESKLKILSLILFNIILIYSGISYVSCSEWEIIRFLDSEWRINQRVSQKASLSEHVKVKTKKLNEEIINTVDFSALDILEKQFELNKVSKPGCHPKAVQFRPHPDTKRPIFVYTINENQQWWQKIITKMSSTISGSFSGAEHCQNTSFQRWNPVYFGKCIKSFA